MKNRKSIAVSAITLAGAIAEVAALFNDQTTLALTLLAVAALTLLVWWGLPRLIKHSKRHYRALVARDKERTRKALGYPTTIDARSGVTTWRWPDGREAHYVADHPTYIRLLQEHRLDPQTTFRGRGPRVPPLPDGWVSRWKLRRQPRQQSQRQQPPG